MSSEASYGPPNLFANILTVSNNENVGRPLNIRWRAERGANVPVTCRDTDAKPQDWLSGPFPVRGKEIPYGDAIDRHAFQITVLDLHVGEVAFCERAACERAVLEQKRTLLLGALVGRQAYVPECRSADLDAIDGHVAHVHIVDLRPGKTDVVKFCLAEAYILKS